VSEARIVLATLLLSGGFSQERPAADLPKGQIPDRGRPTEKGDEVPPFDYDRYFPGKWVFEWRVPETPLGPAGTIQGTEVFEPSEPSEDTRFYRSRVEATGPAGEFTVDTDIVYEKDLKHFARHRRDSRGFDVVETGRIGGDLGGFYTIHFESARFTANGHQVRLQMKTRLVSPAHYKVEAKISVDGGPFTSFGNPWWRKELR
jgi:hypothetical protein